MKLYGIFTILNAFIAICITFEAVATAKSLRKRKCNETGLPLSRQCKKQLGMIQEPEGMKAGLKQVIEKKHNKRKNKKDKRKRKNKKDHRWMPVETDFEIDYEKIFTEQDPWFAPVVKPTAFTPPIADPAFISVEEPFYRKPEKSFKNGLFKRNTDHTLTQNYTKTYSLVGNYGFHSPRTSLRGFGVLVKDPGQNSHFGCDSTIENKHQLRKDGSPWVAVLERGQCDFFYKIRLAKLHNASAVIIYNSVDTLELPIMNTVGTRIPSVIIHRNDGLELVKLLKSDTSVYLDISVTPQNTTEEDIQTESSTTLKVATTSPMMTTSSAKTLTTKTNILSVITLFILFCNTFLFL